MLQESESTITIQVANAGVHVRDEYFVENGLESMQILLHSFSVPKFQ